MKKIENRTLNLSLAGVFAALITLFTAYILHIPVGINGGYIHVGDTFIYVAAALLPTPYAIAAGAIGGGLADLLTSPSWAPATIIIKSLIVLPFTYKKQTLLCKRNYIAPVISFLISGTGYYIAESIMFGTGTALITAFTGSFLQSGSSMVLFYIVASALDKLRIKDTLANVRGRAAAKDAQA